MAEPLKDRRDEAARALEKVRDLLLAGSQEAGIQRDWPLARRLVELAERTDQLHKEVCDVVTGIFPISTAHHESAAVPEEKLPLPPSPTGDTYPRFWVRGGMLVKQGLQRSGKDVYEHAVPRDQFDQILGRLQEIASRRSRREFSVDSIHRDLPDLPKYMLYVVMSLLTKEHLLERARKGAYLLTRPESLAQEAIDLWDKLQKNAQP